MTLSLDIGGANIRSALVSGTIISQYKKIPTPKTKNEILQTLMQTIQSYPKQKSICISTAGFERSGKILNSPHVHYADLNLRTVLKRKFPSSKIYIENDANCAALAESRFGTGKNKNHFILLTLGSGIGTGLITNKKLYKGKGGAVESGTTHFFSEKYIFEDLASGDGSVYLAEKSGLKTNSKQLEDLAKKGNKKALNVYKQVGHYLGIGLANLYSLFDPDCIILGGGFTRVPYFLPEAKRTLNKFYNLSPKPVLLKAKFGDDAGLIGAALLPKN